MSLPKGFHSFFGGGGGIKLIKKTNIKWQKKAIGLNAIYIFFILTIINAKDCSTYRGLAWAIQSAF